MSNTKDIKRAQKESQLHRILSEIFLELVLEEPQLTGIYINKVVLSKDKSCCTILFFCEDQQQFRDSFETLILYKPSMRKAIAQKMASRYVPDFDSHLIKNVATTKLKKRYIKFRKNGRYSEID